MPWGAALTCWGPPLAAAGTPAPWAGQPLTQCNLHSHLAQVLGGLWAARWGQVAQVGDRAEAEKAVAVVSVAAAVSCRWVRRAVSSSAKTEVVRGWLVSSL